MSLERSMVVYSPEHVPIVLTPAGLGRRSVAFIIDSALALGAASLVGDLALVVCGPLGQLVAATLGFLIWWGYHIYFEVRRSGQTPGKRIASLRVADARGLPITFSQSLVRNVVRVLDMIPMGGVGFAATLIDPHGRRLGDIVAGTLVVEELPARVPDLGSLRAPRVNSLDSPRVRRLIAHRVSLEEREFLLALCLRADTLEPQARYQLFESAGTRYRRRLRIDDERLSGENLVRGMVAVLYQKAT